MKRRASAPSGDFDNTAFSASGSDDGIAVAQATYNTDGTASLIGTDGTSPATPKWWDTITPPATWMSFSITASDGSCTFTGGLTEGTRYQLSSARTIGIRKTTSGTASRTMSTNFYDAASGGNLVGTKTLTLSVNMFG